MSLQRLRSVPLAALLLCGCFKYTSIEPAAIRPEEEVRVLVTTDAAVRIGPTVGSITERLEGQLTPIGADSMTLAIWIGKDYQGSPFANVRQRVSLGRREIVEVRRRSLSTSRTGLLAAGVVLVTAVLIDRIVFQPNPNPYPIDRPEPPPEPDPFRGLRRTR